MTKTRSILVALLVGTAPTALLAQAAPKAPAPAEPAAPAGDDEEIVVTAGRRLPGSAIGDIPPEVTLSPADVRAYGASSLSDLLDQLTPQTSSGQGRGGGAPVTLLDGKRISGFGEIRDIPTEAIARVEVLPEEVALKYGYRADQKVVNIVLRRRFQAKTVEVGGGTSTDGGGESGRVEGSMLQIRDGRRINVNVSYQDAAALRESQRDIVSRNAGGLFDFAGNVRSPVDGAEIDPALSALAGRAVTVAGVPASAASGRPTLAQFATTANNPNISDITRYRTLRGANDRLSANAVYARPLGDFSATANVGLTATGSEALRGLAGATLLVPGGRAFSPFTNDVAVDRYVEGQDPLRQRVVAETQHGGFSVNGQESGWNLSLTGNYDRSDTRTRSDRGLDVSAAQAQVNAGALNPFALIPANLVSLLSQDTARAVQNSGDLQIVAQRPLLQLPAGAVSATLKAGGELLGFDTNSLRSGIRREVSLNRQSGNGQINLDLPVTSRREGFLSAVGDVTANLNYTIEELSDFGTLQTLGYGLTWKPSAKVTMIWSMTDEDGAPTVQQLGNPQVLTNNVRVFDFTRGTTVDIAQIDGGNPNLRSDNRRVSKLGLTVRPLDKIDLSLTANYTASRTRNAIASLPAPTAAIEAAFPERFVRDTDGELTLIDNRPVNFARESKNQLRWGFNFSKPLKASPKFVEKVRELRAKGINPFGPGRPQGQQGQQGQAGQQPQGQGQGGDIAQIPRPEGGPPPGMGPGGPGTPGGGRSFGPGGPGGRFGGGGPGGQGGRLQFAVYHSWIFKDEVLIRPGVPVLDLLNGASAGANGGTARHQIEVQSGYANNGVGVRLSADWRSGTTVRGGGGTSATNGDLFYSDLTTVDLRVFLNLSQMPEFLGKTWARGARVSLSVNNILNSRQKVRDAAGLIPVSYQPDYLDPLGREVRISFRKLFF